MQASAQSQLDTYGPQCDSIAALAGIGSNGKHKHNCERDFQRLQVADHELAIVPDPHYMDLVVRRKDKLGLELRRHPILLPHDWFGCCHLAGPRVFSELMVGEQATLDRFWELHEARPQAWQGMGRQDNGHSVPYAIYGDDAGVFEKSKVLFLMMHACLCDKETLQRSFLLTAVPYSSVADGITLEEIYSEITWSLQACERGVHPHLDASGQRLTGWRAELSGKRLAGKWNLTFGWFEGDWKYTKETFHLQSYAHEQCCHLCRCTKHGRFSYIDHRITAPWRTGGRVSHTEYVFRVDEAGYRVPFLDVPGFSHTLIAVDDMHANDQGFCLRATGSIVVWLVRTGVFGHDVVNIKLQRVYHRYLRWCKRTGQKTHCVQFTSDNLHLKGKFVVLTSKAADARHFANFCYDTFIELQGRLQHLPDWGLVLSCSWSLRTYYEVEYSSGTFMDDEQVNRMIEAVRTMTTSLVALHVLSDDKRLWKPKPKDHQLIHLVEDWTANTRCNPRLSANYKNENFMKLMKRMSKSCDSRCMTFRLVEHFLLNAALVWAALAAGREVPDLNG